MEGLVGTTCFVGITDPERDFLCMEDQLGFLYTAKSGN